MQTKVIVVEVRAPANKQEKRLRGKAVTEANSDISTVFLNNKQSHKELTEAFFHELAHVWLQWAASALPQKEQEEIARLVGNVAEPCFRRYGK